MKTGAAAQQEQVMEEVKPETAVTKAARSRYDMLEKYLANKTQLEREEVLKKAAKEITDSAARNNFFKDLEELFRKKLIKGYVYNKNTGELEFFNLEKTMFPSGVDTRGMNINVLEKSNLPSTSVLDLNSMFPTNQIPVMKGTENVLGVSNIVKLFQGQTPKNKLISIVSPKTLQKPKEVSMLAFFQPQSTVTKSSSILSQPSVEVLKQPELLKQPEQLKQPEPQIQKLVLKPRTKFQAPSLEYPFLFSLGSPAGNKKKLKRLLKNPAFVSLVKRRNQWLSLGKPTTKTKAIIQGEKYARHTLGATFKVIQKGETEQLDLGNYNPNPSTFRSYKVSRGRRIPLTNEWIQKRRTRLGTIGEVKEIQMAKKIKHKGGKKLKWM